MPTIAIQTLGCKLNFAESARIVREFVEAGYSHIDYGCEADVTVINSCAVTAQAERKSRYAAKKAKKISPEGQVFVVGCSAQVNSKNFEKVDGITYILGTKYKFNLLKLLSNKEQKIVHNCDINLVSEFENAYSTTERTRSFLKIQDGCDYSCSFCTISKARGHSRNTTVRKIVEQAEHIVSKDIKEIVLTGVNIGDFGKSTNESFYDLLVELDKIENLHRIRISSIEPNLLTNKIINFVANSSKIMPHFHIPLQSGSDDVLKKMKRRYNSNKFVNKILTLNKFIPDAFIGIDVIVGFPTETDENFRETYNLLESLPISYLHIFPYSDRPGTESFEISNKVPSEWIKQRELLLKKLSDKKHLNFISNYLNTNRKVLFESKISDNFISGFTDNYINVVVKSDGIDRNSIMPINLKFVEENYVVGQII